MVGLDSWGFGTNRFEASIGMPEQYKARYDGVQVCMLGHWKRENAS